MGSNKLRLFLFVVALSMSVLNLQAQTFAEFFNQKKTQRKYLIEQIAALKIYTGYLKKGYDVVSTGLSTVKEFSNGEFSLHNSFISSLKTVSPVIRNNVKVVQIISMQLEITKSFRNISKGGLSINTANYVESVRANILEECNNDLGELLLIITSGKVEMEDDERLQRLDKIYESMLNKLAFVQSFSNQVNLVNQQRNNQQRSINQLRQFYEINN